ncbi:hypothetical protein GCM10027259_42610 [Micromonospora palomenae]
MASALRKAAPKFTPFALTIASVTARSDAANRQASAYTATMAGSRRRPTRTAREVRIRGWTRYLCNLMWRMVSAHFKHELISNQALRAKSHSMKKARMATVWNSHAHVCVMEGAGVVDPVAPVPPVEHG